MRSTSAKEEINALRQTNLQIGFAGANRDIFAYGLSHGITYSLRSFLVNGAQPDDVVNYISPSLLDHPINDQSR